MHSVGVRCLCGVTCSVEQKALRELILCSKHRNVGGVDYDDDFVSVLAEASNSLIRALNFKVYNYRLKDSCPQHVGDETAMGSVC